MIKALQELNRMSEEIREKAKRDLPGIISNIVPANPRVKAIAWRQYAPYFNDGEPCEFSVNDPVLVLDDQEVEDAFDSDETVWYADEGLVTHDEKEAIRELMTYFNNDTSVPAFLFGEDSTVTVWKDPERGIEKEAYESHD